MRLPTVSIANTSLRFQAQPKVLAPSEFLTQLLQSSVITKGNYSAQLLTRGITVGDSYGVELTKKTRFHPANTKTPDLYKVNIVITGDTVAIQTGEETLATEIWKQLTGHQLTLTSPPELAVDGN